MTGNARKRGIIAQAVPHIDPPPPSERYRKYEERPLAWADWPDDQDSFVTEKGNPSVKWRGISISHLREREQKAKEAADVATHARHILAVADHAFSRARQDLVNEVESLLGVKVDIGDESCENSPTRTCLYPIPAPGFRADPSIECIFCQISLAEKKGWEQE